MKKSKAKTEKSKSTSKVSIFLILLLTVLIIGSVIFVYKAFESEATSNDDITEQGGLISNFPISSSGEIKDVKALTDAFFVLSDNVITTFANNGKQLYETVLNYSESAVKTSKSYALAYDCKGTSFILLNKKDVVFKGKDTLSGNIITGDVTDSGKFAIASRESGCTSAVTYFNKKGEILFQWLCANEHIISVDISDDEKSLVCAAVSSACGEVFTKAYYFDIKSSDNNREYTFENTAALDCQLVGKKNLILNCIDKRICVNINKADDIKECTFDGSILMRSTDSYGNTAVVTHKSDSFDKKNITMYNKNNDIVYSSEISSDTVNMICSSRQVYAFSAHELFCISYSGKMTSQFSTADPMEGLFKIGSSIYYYTSGLIDKV